MVWRGRSSWRLSTRRGFDELHVRTLGLAAGRGCNVYRTDFLRSAGCSACGFRGCRQTGASCEPYARSAGCCVACGDSGSGRSSIDNDQLAQVGRSSRLKVRRPNGIHADMADDGGDRKLLVYNGRTATLFDPQTKYYATVQAPPTLREVANLLNDRYGIELPAADLFAWGTDKVDTSGIRSADFLGVTQVDGVLTDHFALRQDGFDWQIWIEQGRTPVPRKLLITTTSDPAKPQHSVLMRWNLAPKFAAGIFDFKPPAGSQRIVIQKVDGTLDTPGK
ncbi:DUF2092 domain-containing protein [Variovorax sp. J22R115]|uniref:DUF2092 domain-containing protein n=1 Tax=Variovorax sp. J22R115 TaxID=3053509 RepID=UPI002577ED01|nr:DUF2092 domain-containing protein [Variovorax sp. J22R115]MDM0049619.1 DUF2092 domain-containing protein [Variovorax sp. J22R115]